MTDYFFSKTRASSEKAHHHFAKSFWFAFSGIVHTLKTQKNMQVHYLCALCVSILGMLATLSFTSRIAIILCVAHVFFAEILNTAVEASIDLLTRDFHPLAKIAKDAAAGAVLVCAFASLLIFAAILIQEKEALSRAEPAIRKAAWFFIPLLLSEILGTQLRLTQKLYFLKTVFSLTFVLLLLPFSCDFIFFVLAFILVSLSSYAFSKKEQSDHV